MNRLAVGGLLLLASGAFAQDAETLERIERTLETMRELRFETVEGLTFSETARVLYGGYFTFSGLAVDDFGGNTRILREYDGKFWGTVLWKGHQAYGRLRLQYRDFNSGDSFDGGGDDLEQPIGDRYWYRFDWATDERAEGESDPAWNWWVQIGRQHVEWASGIVLSEDLYAARGGVELGGWSLDFMWATTPRTGTIDFDATRPEFDTDTARDFWGARLAYESLSSHTPYAFFLSQEDENDAVFPGGFFGYDSQYVGVGSFGQLTGQLHYEVEFVWEMGDSASDPFRPPQQIKNIEAWAAKFELIFIPRRLAAHRWRFEFEVLLASGDDDRFHPSHTIGGNAPGTNDESFNAFGFAYTGLALAPDLTNLISVRLTANTFPLRREPFRELRVSVDVFLISKMDDEAPASVPTMPGEGYIGTEVVVGLEWRMTSDTSLDLRYAIFAPGSAIIDKSERHFFYVGLSYGF